MARIYELIRISYYILRDKSVIRKMCCKKFEKYKFIEILNMFFNIFIFKYIKKKTNAGDTLKKPSYLSKNKSK